MQFKLSPTIDPVFAINNRRYAHERREREKGYPCLGVIEITPEGWLLYELVYLVPNEHHWGKFDVENYLLLTDGDKPAFTYELTDDEWHDFASMPPNWSIPF